MINSAIRGDPLFLLTPAYRRRYLSPFFKINTDLYVEYDIRVSPMYLKLWAVPHYLKLDQDSVVVVVVVVIVSQWLHDLGQFSCIHILSTDVLQ